MEFLKNKFGRSLLLLFILVFISGISNGQENDFNYEVECAGSGNNGSQLIKIWGYGKKDKKIIENIRKQAVHAVLFKGVNSGTSNSCHKNPLVDKSDYSEESEYFQEFFKPGGKYMKYVNLAGDGSINPRDRFKIGRKYKIGMTVVVQHTQLRKDLIEDKIIKKFGNGF